MPYGKLQPGQNCELRTVYAPPKTLDKCSQCDGTTSLRLCSACGERIYCSPECQKKDWPNHKVTCGAGNTDRIDLESFYPFLACLAQSFHLHSETPTHPALTHKIINDPNPGTGLTGFPDGSAARLIKLGEEIDQNQVNSVAWWPIAKTESIRARYYRRITCEGFVLPVVTAICIALLAEMYTTTSVPASNSPDGTTRRRIRLRYEGSPISDFGIAWGSVDVKDQDKFVYQIEGENVINKGQDPNNHYWIYFRNLQGVETILDCSIFTFDFCMLIPAQPYLEHGMPQFAMAPAYLRTRELREFAPNIHTERKRVSVLHNTDLHEAVKHSITNFRSEDAMRIWAFMGNFAGGPINELEEHLVLVYSMYACTVMGIMQTRQRWKSYPRRPNIQIDDDEEDIIPAWPQGPFNKEPPEMSLRDRNVGEPVGEDREFAAWMDKMAIMQKLKQEGKISNNEYIRAFATHPELAKKAGTSEKQEGLYFDPEAEPEGYDD